MFNKTNCRISSTINTYDGKFDFAAKSKLAKNNLYLRENKCFPRQRYKSTLLIPLIPLYRFTVYYSGISI